jgi:TcpE family
MELPVYTGLLRIERRLYQVGDVELPAPVTLVEAVTFLASLALLVLVSRALGLGLNPGWAWTYVVVPWLAMRASTTPIADRKRLHLWLYSQARHLLAEPRLLARLRPVTEPAEVRVRVRVWQPASPVRRRRAQASAPRWRAMESLELFKREVEHWPAAGTSSRPVSSSNGAQPPARAPRWPYEPRTESER